jgi:hypothetical protein
MDNQVFYVESGRPCKNCLASHHLLELRTATNLYIVKQPKGHKAMRTSKIPRQLNSITTT